MAHSQVERTNNALRSRICEFLQRKRSCIEASLQLFSVEARQTVGGRWCGFSLRAPALALIPREGCILYLCAAAVEAFKGGAFSLFLRFFVFCCLPAAGLAALAGTSTMSTSSSIESALMAESFLSTLAYSFFLSSGDRGVYASPSAAESILVGWSHAGEMQIVARDVPPTLFLPQGISPLPPLTLLFLPSSFLLMHRHTLNSLSASSLALQPKLFMTCLQLLLLLLQELLCGTGCSSHGVVHRRRSRCRLGSSGALQLSL